MSAAPMCTLLLCICLALGSAAGQTKSNPTVNWVSSPAKHGEHVLVNGGGFSEGSKITVRNSTRPSHSSISSVPWICS
eukprot:SAG31_NODE_5288_length_2630_cov_2.811537_1_plen_78_part_00